MNGKYIGIGLCGYPTTRLAEARKMAAENRIQATNSEEPRMKEAKPLVIPNFVKVAEEFLCIKQKELSNGKHKAQWAPTLEQYAYPMIGKMPVNKINYQ